MNDDQLIKQLEQLKRFEPSEKSLSTLKGRVFSSVRKTEPARIPAGRPSLTEVAAKLFSGPVFLFSVIAALFLVTITLAQGDRLLNQLQAAYMETRIAFTSNGYEKARWSLNLAELQLGEMEKGNGADSGQIAYLAVVSSRTNGYMGSLHLVGQPGEYSAAQCLDVYKEYDNYLVEFKAAIQNQLAAATDPSSRASLTSLLNEANQYSAAADAKLKLY